MKPYEKTSLPLIPVVPALQTMDYPNSLENLSCTLYVETYADPLDAEAYQSGRLIRQINEYKASFHANKREQSYSFDSTLTGVYAPDGQAFYVNTSADPLRLRDVMGTFINIHRAAALIRK